MNGKNAYTFGERIKTLLQYVSDPSKIIEIHPKPNKSSKIQALKVQEKALGCIFSGIVKPWFSFFIVILRWLFQHFMTILHYLLTLVEKYVQGIRMVRRAHQTVRFGSLFHAFLTHHKSTYWERLMEFLKFNSKTWSHKSDYFSSHPYTEKRFLYNFIWPCKKRVLGDEKRSRIE